VAKPQSAAPALVFVANRATDVGCRVRDQRARSRLGSVLVPRRNVVEDRAMEEGAGDATAAASSSARTSFGARRQYATEVAEQLVVAGGEDPSVELEIGGQVRHRSATPPPLPRTPPQSRRDLPRHVRV
jgi:hypothetical protein